MIHKHRTNKNGDSHTNESNRSVHKVYLEDLQQYFDENVLDFEEYEGSEDPDAAFSRQYEEQVTDFLQRIGAMVSVETFFAIIDDAIVSVRKVPSSITPVTI